jgi:hypothetical protein
MNTAKEVIKTVLFILIWALCVFIPAFISLCMGYIAYGFAAHYNLPTWLQVLTGLVVGLCSLAIFIKIVMISIVRVYT